MTFCLVNPSESGRGRRRGWFLYGATPAIPTRSPWPRRPSSCRRPRRRRAPRRGSRAPRSRPPSPARRRWPGRARGRRRRPGASGRPRSRLCAAAPRTGPPGPRQSGGAAPSRTRARRALSSGGAGRGPQAPAGGAGPGSSAAADRSPWPGRRRQEAGKRARARVQGSGRREERGGGGAAPGPRGRGLKAAATRSSALFRTLGGPSWRAASFSARPGRARREMHLRASPYQPRVLICNYSLAPHLLQDYSSLPRTPPRGPKPASLATGICPGSTDALVVSAPAAKGMIPALHRHSSWALGI